ncbi:MAG: hypothetical protein LJE68_15245 [Rhodobacter sp.]|nr:hypothetical protein [Rhodobacter sp.]
MKRTHLIAATALIGIAATAVIATAHERGDEAGMGRHGFGPVMLLEHFDTDSDGSITQAEIDAVAAEHFALADTDGDGKLSAAEMTAAAEARRAERVARRIEARIAEHDSDGDGMLSLEEATAGAADAGMGRMFERFDADGDGAITKAELESASGMFGRGHHRGHDWGHERGHDRGEHGGRGHNSRQSAKQRRAGASTPARCRLPPPRGRGRSAGRWMCHMMPTPKPRTRRC